jgi:hypothetical protein
MNDIDLLMDRLRLELSPHRSDPGRVEQACRDFLALRGRQSAPTQDSLYPVTVELDDSEQSAEGEG